MRINRGLLIVLAAVAGVAFHQFRNRIETRSLKHSEVVNPIVLQQSAPAAQREAVVARKTPSFTRSRSGDRYADVIERLRQSVGHNIRIERDSTGQVTRIAMADVNHSVKASPDFDLSSPRSLIERAREILDLAAPLMGVSEASPLVSPIAQSGALSGQVIFLQQIEGLSVEPYGRVTVRLGSMGEFLGIDSSYVSNVRREGEVRVDQSAARKVAMDTLTQDGRAPANADEGRKVAWASRPSSDRGFVSARTAYEFHMSGRKVIVDAETGEVLARKDERIY